MWLAGVAAGVLVLNSTTASATTYYVRTSGSDTNDGLTPQAALASIRTAGRLLLAPGDRVVVGPGTYAEGNIEPFGSGSRDQPIVFEADPSGQQTGDAPGAVTISPPNEEDSTTGFIIFGKHDIRITGFTVDGARDAGIQARPGFSTGIDSTRITLEGNTITNSISRGISIIAAGDVEVAGNAVVGNGLAGISLFSGQSPTPLRPFIHDNVCERTGVAVAAERIAGGTIENNTIRNNRRGLGIVSGRQLVIRGNEIIDCSESMVIGGEDLELTDNLIERDGHNADVSGSGTLTFRRNRFVRDGFLTDLNLRGSGLVRLVENDIPNTILLGRADLELLRNTGAFFTSTGRSIVARENQWTGGVELFGTADVEIAENRFRTLGVKGDEVTIHDNEAATTRIEAKNASVLNNQLGSLFLAREELTPGMDADADGAFHVEGNRINGEAGIGEGRVAGRSTATSAVVQNNEIADSLFVIVSKNIEVRDNSARSIFCHVIDPDSEVTITDNVARGHGHSGIIVRGARSGIIERNESSQNIGSGFAIRRAANLTFRDNVAFANQRGGISIDIGTFVVGDCNNDNDVTVDEIIRAVDIVLGNRKLRDCLAIDATGDEVATVDEIILAIDAALGLNQPEEPEGPDGEVVITANTVEDNALYGIDMFTAGPVVVSDNRVLRNGGSGVTAQLSGPGQMVELVRNQIGSNQAEGVFLSGTASAQVRGNVIFSNGESGVLLRNARDVSVVNNLIYDNGNDGIAVGVGTPLASPDALLMNNTLYANAGWGVTVGTALAPSTGTTILNNIFDGNGRGGIAAEVMSLSGLEVGFNLNNDGYAHDVVPSVTDFQADPRFVDIRGPDGVLGDVGFEDDDFHLQPESAAVDAGSATATQLGITGSALSGEEIDEGIVDLGFHYFVGGEGR